MSSANSGIAWCDSTWNPIRGCSIASTGCASCYAVPMAARLERMTDGKSYVGLTEKSKGGQTLWTGKIEVAPDHVWEQPMHWRTPKRIFVNSMSDLFHPGVPDGVIDRVFATAALCPQHTFIILTKRSDRMKRRGCDWRHSVARNVWLGVSCENQETADERIPDLLATPAAVRVVSAEPLLGRIDLRPYLEYRPAIDWVIVGGESGPRARHCEERWIREVRHDCSRTHVAFFLKQIGSNATHLRDRKGADPSEWPADLRVQEFPRKDMGIIDA
jgi:protein gp37